MKTEKPKAGKYEMVPVDWLIPYVRNSKKHGDAQVDQIAASIREFGFLAPVVTTKEYDIMAGHGRILAAKKLGMTHVPCVLVEHLTEAQRRAYVLADNKLTEKSEWDEDMLKVELSELRDLSFDLSLTGFDPGEIADLLDEDEGEAGDPPDAPPEEPPEVPVSRHGDVWLCGHHRVLCGDSTSLDDVAKVMAGGKADLVFTDPPYNLASHAHMGAAAELRPESFGKLNDSAWDKNFDITKIFASIEQNIADNASCYVCTSHFLLPLLLPWAANFFDYSNMVVWAKPNPMPSLAKRHWTWCHEPIVYGTRGKHVFNFPDEGHALSVWDMMKVQKAEYHPTQKPVEVPVHAIKHSSKEGQIVLDLFGGSGTTLIAAEHQGRRARLVEINPGYVDVIVKRWQDATGRAAIHEASGNNFAQLEAIRKG